MDIDSIVSDTIQSGEDTLTGESSKKKQTIGGAILRFFVSLIWVIVSLVFSLLGALVLIAHQIKTLFEGQSYLFIIAIAIPVIFFIITMCVPYLRKKGSVTRYAGFVCLGDAIWWMYLLFTDFQ